VTDLAELRAEWDRALARRPARARALAFWTPILDGWLTWPAGSLAPLAWTASQCRERWERGVPLIVEAPPDLAREALDAQIGPVLERLAVAGHLDALRRFAETWDAGGLGPGDLFLGAGKGGPASIEERIGVPAPILSFLAQAGLRPGLDAYFSRVRAMPEGVWPARPCPWCGGPPAFVELVAGGRRRLSCHLCGGAWAAAAPGCAFCGTVEPGAVVALTDETLEDGDIVEACRSCRSYLKGVDRRRRYTAGSPLVEDWSTPDLDVRAMSRGYRRPTPSLAHLLDDAVGGASPAS
jgi:hypothetical protein